MEKTKLTKKEVFANLLEEEVIQSNPEYKELIEKQIKALSKPSKSSMNLEEVKAVLSIVPKPVAEIAEAASLTERQAVSRLSKLIAEGFAVKENVTIEGRKLVAYRLKEEN
jgi:hypothetical protein